MKIYESTILEYPKRQIEKVEYIQVTFVSLKRKGKNDKNVVRCEPLEVNTKMKPAIHENIWKMNPSGHQSDILVKTL